MNWKVLFVAGVVGLAGCRTPARSGATVERGGSTLALVGGTIHASPEAAPIPEGVVLISAGRISAVGPRSQVEIPEGATVIDTSGQTLLAGFWNSHVHFTEPWVQDAAHQPAAVLEQHLRDMLLRHGFVHVVDTGSAPEDTLALRRRIEAGELAGPGILTAGTPLVPVDGTPRYVPMKLPELQTPEQARAMVKEQLAGGSDGIKLFTASLTARNPFPVMPLAIVQAVTDEAHAQGKPVFAHPTNAEGLTAAVEGGVDVVVHTAPMAGSLPDAFHEAMVRRKVALVPTLSLFEWEVKRSNAGPEELEHFTQVCADQVRRHARLGGRVLFGTDVGYMPDDDPRREYVLMQRAGLSVRDILASLTTSPAAQFGQESRAGRLAPGLDADVVVVEGDPSRDIEALANVRLVLRQGKVVFRQER
ncbi:amidohydrolase family protein [Vitiosangium sp. GDMCC 1.1324]|uniref:amidohydrolase family protein n=1 Tax=Vitiosangium sp. (strain GDMCC 1.1324) TaxID=2138576 RepID=UPI00130DB509|nr:amidohydrolase family protein [Vitiosangium sp. GDMCC 1.1324]